MSELGKIANEVQRETNGIADLTAFLKKAPTAYQAVSALAEELKRAGATELTETEKWELAPDRYYFVKRNDSAMMAFYVPREAGPFRVYAAHGDSPAYKIKENPEITVEGKYIRLNTERYGGMIAYSWFDRPLSVAGRVIVRSNGKLVSVPVNVDRDLLLIPSVAIHMTRDDNDAMKFNPQNDLLPLFGEANQSGKFMKIVAEAAKVDAADIVGHDLYLYIREEARVWGADNEFFSGPHIDDLECVLAGFRGFMAAEKRRNISVLAVFDNEEVGSSTRQGAASTFLSDTLDRISAAIGDTREDYLRRIAGSFMASADNGHAVHPNHPEKTDPTNRPVLNGGVLLKYSANQRYTTDGLSAAIFKEICRRNDVPFQIYFNRSDMLGGSTLGNLSVLQVPFATADIGLAELSMHSVYETAGVRDYDAMVRFAKGLFE